MVKRISPTEMIEMCTNDADRPSDETNRRLETPQSVCIENAIHGNIDDLKNLDKGIDKYIQEMSEYYRVIEEAASETSRACEVVRFASDLAIAEIFDTKEIAKDVARRVIDWISTTEIDMVDKSISKNIEMNFQEPNDRLFSIADRLDETVDGAQTKMDDSLEKMDRVMKKSEQTLIAAKSSVLNPMAKAAIAFALVLSIATSAASYVVLDPIIAGEARIIYTD